MFRVVPEGFWNLSLGKPKLQARGRVADLREETEPTAKRSQ